MTRDTALIIKNRLSMHDVLTRYGFVPKRRIKCPLHNGDSENFEVREKTYTCYSHCGSGDVLTFVQKLFGLSFADTLKKIDEDFALGLYKNATIENTRRARWELKKIQSAKNHIEERIKEAETKYWEAFDEWARLDKNKIMYAPKSPEEEPHPLFVEALQNISYKKYLLDCAEDKWNAERYNNKCY